MSCLFSFLFLNFGGLSLFYKKGEQYYFEDNTELYDFLLNKNKSNFAVSNYSSNDVENDIIWIKPHPSGRGYSNDLEYIYQFNQSSILNLVVVSFHNHFKSDNYSYEIIDKSSSQTQINLYQSGGDKVPESEKWILSYHYLNYVGRRERNTPLAKNTYKQVVITFDDSSTKEITFCFIYSEDMIIEEINPVENQFINDFMNNLQITN